MAEERSDPQLDALGSLVALIPEVDQLVEYRKSLGDGLDEDARGELVLQRARELGLAFGGDRLIEAGELPPSLLDMDIGTALGMALQALPEKFATKTLRDILLRLSAASGVDAFIVRYVEETVTTGKPGRYAEVIRGDVVPVTLTLPDTDEPLSMVVLVATPYSRIEELVAKLRDTASDTFRDYTVHEADTLYEAGRMYEYKQAGLTHSQIAWLNLAERFPEIRALTLEERKREYGPEHKRELARMRQLRRRL